MPGTAPHRRGRRAEALSVVGRSASRVSRVSVRSWMAVRITPCATAAPLSLTIAAEGSKADIAKPLKGLGPGVMEIAVRYRSDAWRVVYVTQIAGTLWVIHAFQKKSRTGIKTPKAEVELVRARLRWLKRELRS